MGLESREGLLGDMERLPSEQCCYHRGMIGGTAPAAGAAQAPRAMRRRLERMTGRVTVSLPGDMMDRLREASERHGLAMGLIGRRAMLRGFDDELAALRARDGGEG